MRNRGYYLNSLRAWNDELLRSQKISVTRLRSLQRANHPDAEDQELLIDLRATVIGLIIEAEHEATKTHEAAYTALRE